MVLHPARRHGYLLVAPAALVFVLLLAIPLGFLVRVSLFPPGPNAPLAGPATLGSYFLLVDGYYVGILLRTVRVAALTTLRCLVLGYPPVISIARSHGGVAHGAESVVRSLEPAAAVAEPNRDVQLWWPVERTGVLDTRE